MASVPDGNSPPRQDHLSKTRRQSALLDSPSRVTRSQVRRLSSAPVEVTMSPKPSTRRRSTIAPGSKNDTTNQDQVSPVQESEESVKSLPKRRSVRTSFSEPIEEVPPSSRSSKLTSIDEDLKSISAVESRPLTRRTRASMASLKTPVEPEPELSLPTTTRRTRRSSISSVSSITSSVVASPKRQTRSRKNLSPVPSPTASEVSTVSEVPETSPASKVSPVQVRSPLTKTTEKLLGTPRQLDFGDTNRPKTRSSFVVSDDQSEIVVSSAETGEGSQPGRRSHGRLSLKSPLKFVETDMEDTTKSNTEVVKPSNDNEDYLEPDFNKSRISVDRLSLSSKKSSCLSPSSQKASPAKDVNSDIILFGNESKTNSASRSPIIMLTKLRDEREDSETEGQTKRSSLRKSPPFKFDVSDKESQLETSNPKTSEENVSNIHNNSRRSSIRKIFLENSLSDKVPSDKVSNEDSSLTDSTEQQVFEVEDSSDTISVDVGVDKSNCRRFSLTSNKTTVDKHESTDGSPKLEAKGRFSLSSNKSTPAKSPKFDNLKVSNTDGQKSPLDRFSLSSKKSTPAKSLNSEGLHQGDTATPLSGSAKSSSKVSPANALNSTQLENDDPPNTFLSRFSLSFNNSTPAKVSPAKGESTPQLQLNESRGSLSARLSLSSNKSAQGTADESKHFVDNEESDQDSSSDSSERHEPIEDLNLSSKVGESSPRKSMGRPSLTPNKSLNASRGSSSGRLSLSSNKSAQATADKSEHNLDNEESDADTSSDSSEHNEPPEYLDSPVKTGESSPRKSMGRPSLTPRNESHSTSSARLSLSSNNSAQASADKSEHFVDNEESDDGSSSDSAEHHEPIEDLNLSSKVGESSPRKSMGRPSLTPNKSLNESRGSSSGRLSLSSNKSAHGTADKPEHNLDNEESDTDSSLDSSELNEPAEHLNLSVKTGESSPRKSIGRQSPCKSLNKSQDQEENAIIGTSDKAFKFFPQLNHNDLSRRASTGNVSSKPLKSNSKTRASMGTLINPFVSYVNFSEDKDASSDSLSENGHNSQNISDEHEFGGGDVTLSPIKKDNPIKKRSPTPVSEKSCSVTECQNSPSNLFEKSTVFNEESFESNSETSEQALESSVSSLQSKKLNTSGNNGNISIADDLPKEVTELNSSKKSSKSPAKDVSKEGNNLLCSVSSDIGKKLGSTNVYKAAAALMKGGNFSDFDDNDSDDSQLQPVFSSTATSRMEKKLLQKQKKAQRRAEKEARKKLQKEQQLNQEPDSSKRSKKRRQKALSQSENDTPLIENANLSPSPSKNEENPTEENIQNAKKIKKQRSGSVGFGLAGTTDHENNEAINILSVAGNGSDETECKTKKKKKKATDGAASETKSTVDNADLKKKKKQKKVSEDASPVEEISLKKKKKPKSLLEDGLSVEELPKKKKRKLKEVLEDGSAVDELPKKKKKKLKLKEVSDDRSPQEELFVKKKKKLGVTSENQPLQVAVTTNSLKAVRKKDKHLVLQPSTASEENFSVSNSLQEKKKSKKDKFPVVGGSMEMSKKSSKKGTSDADEINTTELRNETTLKKKSKKLVKKKSIPDQMEDTSEKQHEKKKKKKLKEKNVPVVAADVSDDDAPTSVSFAAGKNAAMELMEAAAEGVQNQIRLKQEQEKKRRDRMLHEKSAKMEKLKKKSHNFGAESSSSVKVSLLAPSSSKIYFDDKGNSLKNKAPKRLPADILDSLSEQPPTKFVKRSDGSKETAATLSGKQQDKMEKKKAKKLALKMEKKKVLESEYIPLDGVLGATRFGVVPLRNVMLAKKLEKNKLAEEAANFRQQNLFGNRIRRTPISTTISYQEKLKASLKGK